jgi:asparagine synthase (glutamine-hydrolysing)
VRRIAALTPDARYTRPPKLLLQAALDPRLPPDMLRHRKRGFNPPLRDWLRVQWRSRLDGLGHRLDALSAGQLAAPGVDALVAAYRDGAEHFAEQLLQLLMLDESLAQLAELARSAQ